MSESDVASPKADNEPVTEFSNNNDNSDSLADNEPQNNVNINNTTVAEKQVYECVSIIEDTKM